MKSLLTVTAVFEAITGVALFAVPSVVVSLLLGSSLTEPSGMLVCRVSGIALLSLAFACWQARNNTNPSGIIQAMLFYNIAVGCLLAYCVFIAKMSGMGLWPAIILHAGLAIWCVRSLQWNRNN